MVLSCVIGCCNEVFKKFALPIFIAFTLLFALLVAISICGFKSKIVLMAAGLTFLLVLALTAYACNIFINKRVHKNRLDWMRPIPNDIMLSNDCLWHCGHILERSDSALNLFVFISFTVFNILDF